MTKKTPRLRCSSFELLALVSMTLITSSCTTPKKSDPSTHLAPSVSSSWVKVSSKPSTWYPRGVPSDHPTDFKSGAWVYSEDTLDTRFFIPVHGLPPEKRKALVAEALATRHPNTVRRNNMEEASRKAKAAGSMIVISPFLAFAEVYPQLAERNRCR